jgi:hypothetical protein
MSAKKKSTTKKTAASKPRANIIPADHGSNEEEHKEGYQERMRKMKPHERVSAKLLATIDRFKYIVEELVTWKNGGELLSSAEAALAAIEETSDAFSALPKDFVAEKPRKSPTVTIAIGTKVNLREKFFATYDGYIDGKDRVKLVVEGVRKGRVVLRTQQGDKVFVPRGHVEVIESPAATDKKTKAA